MTHRERKRAIRNHRAVVRQLRAEGGFFTGIPPAPGTTIHSVTRWHLDRIMRLGKNG